MKRIMQEASKSSNPEEDDFVAAPLEVGLATFISTSSATHLRCAEMHAE